MWYDGVWCLHQNRALVSYPVGQHQRVLGIILEPQPRHPAHHHRPPSTTHPGWQRRLLWGVPSWPLLQRAGTPPSQMQCGAWCTSHAPCNPTQPCMKRIGSLSDRSRRLSCSMLHLFSAWRRDVTGQCLMMHAEWAPRLAFDARPMAATHPARSSLPVCSQGVLRCVQRAVPRSTTHVPCRCSQRLSQAASAEGRQGVCVMCENPWASRPLQHHVLVLSALPKCMFTVQQSDTWLPWVSHGRPGQGRMTGAAGSSMP